MRKKNWYLWIILVTRTSHGPKSKRQEIIDDVRERSEIVNTRDEERERTRKNKERKEEEETKENDDKDKYKRNMKR